MSLIEARVFLCPAAADALAVGYTERCYEGQHMKTVTVFVGSTRKKSTYNIECEIVALGD